MAFQVSPGVNVTEIDLTTVIPAVSTSTGAFAGKFQWGPVDTITQISTENDLVSQFGKPDSNTYESFFTAANFLSYSYDLRLVRSANTGSYNSTAHANSFITNGAATTIQIKNQDSLDNVSFVMPANTAFVARYPGELGNSLKVFMWANSNVVNFNAWAYSSLFDKAPNTTNYIRTTYTALANDELHLVVVDVDGKISGTPNTVLEKYASLSKATNARNESGESNYYKDVILRKSKYIYVAGAPEFNGLALDNWQTAANSSKIFAQSRADYNVFTFADGTDATVTDGDLMRAYDQFDNPEYVDISLVMTGNCGTIVIADVINNVAGSRKDCVAFVSPTLANVQSSNPTTAIVDYRKNSLSNISSSYAVMDGNYKYQYDKYNDVYRWIPLNGDIAGLCARTDNDRDPWYSPAGLSRGQIKNVVKLAWYPSKANRDELYKNDINPVISAPGTGTVLYGDKTMLGYPSAFDRINVRRLFIVLEKAISRAAKNSLFEFNDEFTRAQFVNLVEPFLRTVQGRRGIYDYRVVCDTTNNTPEIIDRNEFVGDIYIKPARSINYIQLNFIAVRTGVAFDEVVGKF